MQAIHVEMREETNTICECSATLYMYVRPTAVAHQKSREENKIHAKAPPGSHVEGAVPTWIISR